MRNTYAIIKNTLSFPLLSGTQQPVRQRRKGQGRLHTEVPTIARSVQRLLSAGLLAFCGLMGSGLLAQPLPELLDSLKSQNLMLRQKDTEMQAALERMQLAEIPVNNPSVSIGAFPLPVETRLGAQTVRASVTQPFMWPGTYAARKAAAEGAFRISQEEKEWRFQQLALEFAKAYFRIGQIENDRQLMEKQLSLLVSWEDISLQQLGAGKGTMAEVLRIKMQKREQETALANLNSDLLMWQAQLNGLLNRSADAAISFVPLSLEKERMEGGAPYLPVLRAKAAELDQKEKLLAVEKKPTFGVALTT